MKKKVVRLLAVAGLVAASATAVPFVQGATADELQYEPWAPCPDQMWCIYDGGKHDGYWIPAPYQGDLAYQDWDTVSSGINNTNYRVCFYSYRGDGTGDADLVGSMDPHSAMSYDYMGDQSSANDKIDAVRVYYRQYECPEVML